jgi:predicted metal-dependent hydrolase
MRNNHWLATRLDGIYQDYFSDVPIQNLIIVRFGRPSKTRFGSIIARPHPSKKLVTHIAINSLFQDETVPEYVIDATLAHEFAHYTHGFHSPLPRKYKFPHRGDIVNKEIRQRGAGHLLEQQQTWIKGEYRDFLRKHNLI